MCVYIYTHLGTGGAVLDKMGQAKVVPTSHPITSLGLGKEFLPSLLVITLRDNRKDCYCWVKIAWSRLINSIIQVD